MLMQLAKFAVLAGVTFFIAWLAGIGRVAYILVMLWIAAAFATPLSISSTTRS